MDRRAWALKREYKGAMTELDRKYLGTIQGQTGPLVTRLDHLVGGSRTPGNCDKEAGGV